MEMTLTKKGNGMELMMGYLDARHLATFSTDTYIGKTENECSLYVVDGYYPRKYSNGIETNINQLFRFQSKVGDKFGLMFSMEENSVGAYYNNKCIGLLTNELPERIYLCASVYYKDTEFETTVTFERR